MNSLSLSWITALSSLFWKRISDTKSNVLRHLTLSRLRSEAWVIARNSGLDIDWNRSSSLNDKFTRRLKRFYSHVEWKVIADGRKSMIYRLLNSRLHGRRMIGAVTMLMV